MLSATVQKLGDTTVLRCQGRIVIGDAYTTLRSAALSQTHTRMLVLDLAQVDRIDAGGLGVLLGLREWASSDAISLRLMNVMNQVDQVLELTKLDRVFEFCSVRDIFHLLHPGAAVVPWSVDQNRRMLKDNRKLFSQRARRSSCSTEGLSSCCGYSSRAGVGQNSGRRAEKSVNRGIGARRSGPWAG